MSQKFYSEVTLETLNNATTDTDRFLVGDSGTIKYRTGSQLLSDLGVSGLYVPYTGAIGNVDLGTHTLSSYNLIITHTSGSGVAASITKGGNGEALTINKTSGSGNAVSVLGGLTSLVDLTLSSILNATIDTDRFIVSDGGAIKYRTGAQVLSDIGGQAALTNPITGTGTTNYVSKFTGANTLGNSLIFDNGTNVGIGTTSPAEKLTLAGNFSLIGDYNIAIDLTTNGNSKIGRLDRAFLQVNRSNFEGFLSFHTTSSGAGGLSERMRITSGGNLLLGTTTDSGFKLDVNGESRFIGNSADGGGRILLSSKASLGSLEGQFNDGTTLWQIRSFGGPLRFGTDNAQSLQFYTNGITNPRLNIDTNGNVGIGTTSPFQSKVHILKSESGSSPIPVLRIGNQGAGYTSRIVLTDETTNDANISYIGSLQSLGFGVGASLSQMVINSSGNVGIGTTSPTRKLHVDGGIRTTAFYEISNGLTNIAAIGSEEGIFGTGGNNFVFYNPNATSNVFYTSGSERMRINANGNVGIGTTSPGVKLDVNGSVRAGNANQTALLVAASGTATTQAAIAIQQLTVEGDTIIFADFEPYAEYGIIARNSLDSIDFTGGTSNGSLDNYNITNRSGAARTAYVKARIGLGSGNTFFGGNVGIGTISPLQRLHIASTGVSRILIENTDNSGAGAGLQMLVTSGGTLVGNGTIRTDNTDQMQFFNLGGERMRITNTGNVGIGTTSPADKLSVAGIIGSYSGASNLKFNPFANNSNKINSTNFLAIQDDTTNAVGIGYNSDTNPGGPSAKLWVNGGIYNSTGLHNVGTGYFGGNVGIGTTSPAEKLTINGGALRLESSTGVSSYVHYISPGNDEWSAGMNGAYDFQIAYSNGLGTPRMTLLKGGNVGIGTTSPSEILHLQSSQPVIRYTRTGILNWKVGLISGNTFTINTDASGGDAFNITSTGNVGIGTTTPQSPLSIGTNHGTLISIGQPLWANNIVLRTSWDGSDFTQLLVPSNGANTAAITLRNSGNVGIGTTSPGQKLDVRGNIYTNGTNTNLYLDNGGAGGASLQIGVTGSTSTYINSVDAHPLLLLTSNTERMRITSGGNVGIGTTSPSAKLDVDANGYSIIANNGTGNRSLYLGTNGGEPSIQATLSNGSPRQLSLNPSGGNVGIGTTNPNYQTAGRLVVDINGSSQSLLGFSIATNPTAYIASTSTLTELASVSNPLLFTVGSERMRITSSGNVGIGTTSPTHKLSVQGNASIVNNSSLFLLDTAGNGGFSIKNTSSNVAAIQQQNNGELSLQAGFSSNAGNIITFKVGAGTEVVRINNSGNVGIGTTSPSAKLQVVGSNSVIRMTSTNSNSELQFNNTSATSWIGAYGNSLGFYAGQGSVENMRITSGGNVGIGTTSPNRSLVVVGGNQEQLVLISTTTRCGIALNPSNTTFSPYIGSTGNDIVLDTFGSERMRITSSGNVGIGTTSPIHPLSVVGRIGGNIFGDSHIEFLSNGDTSLKANNSVLIGYSQSTVVTQSGNVGINTTAPASSALLDLKSDTQGFLPPRMGTASRDNILSPAIGLMIYNEETETVDVYTSTRGWRQLQFI